MHEQPLTGCPSPMLVGSLGRLLTRYDRIRASERGHGVSCCLGRHARWHGICIARDLGGVLRGLGLGLPTQSGICGPQPRKMVNYVS